MTAIFRDSLVTFLTKENICKATVVMNYVNYDKSIVLAHRIKLTGWPESVPFMPLLKLY